MFEHRDADRIPLIDAPWGTTVDRWRREGLPQGVDWCDYFDMDKTAGMGGDTSPRYPGKVIEETDEYTIYTTSWGVTMKNWKHLTSTPGYVDYTVRDRATWEQAKARMTPTSDRIDWEHLKNSYAGWKEAGHWIQLHLAFGFDLTHSSIIGTENLLFALAEDPEWCREMFEHELDMSLGLAQQIWDAGYRPDSIFWCDDMGYKGHQFFSIDVYREFLKPVHKRAIDWAHAKGIKAHLHSCGDVRPLVPELLEIGLDALNPLEVKAGMNPVELKRQYGDKLVLHGGINAVLWTDFDAITAEMERVLPKVKENGGYIFSSDHSVPDAVSFEDFGKIVALAKKLGSYE
jgi:uroporphyrinogen decarboxylase